MSLVSKSTACGAAVALAMALALAGCTGGAQTLPAATPTPTAPTKATPTHTPTPAATATPESTPTADASPSVDASPTAGASPSADASPTSPAAVCTGTADNRAFFTDAAGKLHFDVYCATLPAGWWLQGASYVLKDGGYLEVQYKNSAGAAFTLREGRWCPPEMACIAAGGVIGPASFGSTLSGTLYLMSTTYTLRVGTAAKPAYLMVGSGMTQAQFKARATALVVVPNG